MYDCYCVTQVVSDEPEPRLEWAVFFVEADGTPRPIDGKNVFPHRQNAYRRCKQLNTALRAERDAFQRAIEAKRQAMMSKAQ